MKLKALTMVMILLGMCGRVFAAEDCITASKIAAESTALAKSDARSAEKKL